MIARAPGTRARATPTSPTACTARGRSTSSSSYDWGSHIEAIVEQPLFEAFLLSLARFSRVLWFDMRGIGMSSPVVGDRPIEWWVDDLVAVMDAEGSQRATLVAHGHATQMAVMAAASHPERVSSLVLLNGFARYARADDYPAGMPPHVQEIYKAHIEANWGNGTMALVLGPSIADRPGIVDWWGRVERLAATPVRARSRLGSVLELDVRHVLPLVEVPTLVIHSRDNEYVRVGHGRYLAENIRGARLVERDSADHWPLPDVGPRRPDRGIRHRLAARVARRRPRPRGSALRRRRRVDRAGERDR